MPHKWTFTIHPIKGLLKDEMQEGKWCDPFSGSSILCAIRNDISPSSPSQHHMDALEFLRQRATGEFDGVLFDPPYSFTQAKEHYKESSKSFGNSAMKYWSNVKNEIARITKDGGKVICFGWNSMGLGAKRGFEMYRILLVPHGGSRNDTIVTCERKLPSPIVTGKQIGRASCRERV